MEIWESNRPDSQKYNLHEPPKKPNNRKEFWDDYKNRGFEFILKKYAGNNLKSKAKEFIKKKFPLVETLYRKIR